MRPSDKVIKLAVLVSTEHELKFKYITNLWISPEEDKVDGWIPLLIALCIGAPLYGLKRKHIIRTDLLILSFMLVPLLIFYTVLGVTGVSMQQMRDRGWFLTTNTVPGSSDDHECISLSFSSVSSSDSSGSSSHSSGSSSDPRQLASKPGGPYCPFERVNVWHTLELAYSSELVAWGALPRCVAIWLMGACITALDNMLKLSSSENALKVDLDYNHEMKVGGGATLLSALLCGMPSCITKALELWTGR